ncbi:MAG: hypothetical protein KKH98_13705 [Spirochaetes bacterium]|nr:hypothetical protein [Spirochaetota bacterium]
MKQNKDGTSEMTDSFQENTAAGSDDILPIMLSDASTNEIFKTFGGKGNDGGKSILKINEREMIIVGSKKQKGIWSDVWIIKIETNGNKIWEKVFGGDHIDWGEDISSYDLKSFYIAGTTYSYGAGKGDIYLMKIDKDGNKLWEKYFGGLDWEGSERCLALSDGCVIAGWTSSQGEGKQEIYIMKTDPEGRLKWETLVKGTKMDDYANSICSTEDGFLVAGAKSRDVDTKNIWILKLNTKGKILWDRVYGEKYHCEAKDIIQDNSGFLVIGSKTTPARNKDIWIFKIDKQGTILWEKVYGSDQDEEPNKIIRTKKGNYMICGYTQNIKSRKKDIIILNINGKGEKIREFHWDRSKADEAEDITAIGTNEYIITGAVEMDDEDKKDLLFLKVFLK